MKNKKKRISYIRKPIPKQSFFYLVLFLTVKATLFAVIFNTIFGILAAWALTSLLFSVEAVICGVKTLKMKEVNYILARIGTIVGGVLLFCWLGMLVIGVLTVI